MKKKHNNIIAKERSNHRPPKAKVVRSNRAGSTSLPLPKRGQLIEIPEDYEVVERIGCTDFVHKRTLFVRRKDANLFENDLKSHRVVRSRSQRPAC